MSNHGPISPPLSNDADSERSFNAGPNESPFLHSQQFPDTIFGQPEDDQKFSFAGLEMDNVSRAMEQYPSTNVYVPVCRNDHSQITSVPQLPFVRASQLEAPSQMNTEIRGMADVAKVSKPVSGKPRVSRAKRMRKRPKPPARDRNDVEVPAPLSELTKHLTGIDIADTEAYVRRSSAQRQHEAKAKKGKIPRPMNSFMLYRQAYSERAKEWCSQNNHQVVSVVTGKSWAHEPPEIKEFFERMAQLERENHKVAHPTYKFTPNKNGNMPKKRRMLEEDAENGDNDDDIDIPPATQYPGKQQKGPGHDDSFHSRNTTPFDHIEHGSSYSSYESRTSTPFDPSGDHLYGHSDINKSSWEIVNPGKPVPGVLSPPRQNHYYQPSVHQRGSNIEDVTYRRMNVPGVQYDTSAALTGIPGGAHHELLQPQPPHSGTPVSIDGIQVDPQLFESNSLSMGLSQAETEQYVAAQQFELWHPFHQENQHYTHSTSAGSTIRAPEGTNQYQASPAYHPTLPSALDGHELWDEAQVGAGATNFNEWMPATY